VRVRIPTRTARTIVALLAATALPLAIVPGSAVAAPKEQPSRPSASLRPEKQATSFQRTAKTAATLAASEIRWELRTSNTAGSPDLVFAYGGVTAVAVVTGDWDGNGTHTIGVVYAASDGQLEWQLRNSNTAGTPDVVVRFGGVRSIPVTGDWDGNGTTTIGVAFARTDGQIGWALRNSNSAGLPDVVVAYGGLEAFAILTGDWDGRGGDTVGVVYERSGELEWQLRDANTPGLPDHVFRYGGLDAGAVVTGDWDGNATWTPGVVY
jgi:hypothetical protein